MTRSLGVVQGLEVKVVEGQRWEEKFNRHAVREMELEQGILALKKGTDQ